MNSITGFNTADQIIAALYNVSEFKTYNPGFNTIKINSSQNNLLDITNIENSHVGFNLLLPPPEINYSLAIVGGIDNSGGLLLVGPHVSKIVIGNTNCVTNISGAFNVSEINTSNINTQTIQAQSIETQSILVQNINTSGTLSLGELSDIVNLGSQNGTVIVNGELNTNYIDASGDVLNIGLFSEKIELGNHEKDINVNGIINAYDTINAYNEVLTPILDNPDNKLTIGQNAKTIIMGNVSSNMSIFGNVFTSNITNASYLTVNSRAINFSVRNILLNGTNGEPGTVLTSDIDGKAVWGQGSVPKLSQVTNMSNYTNANIVVTDDVHKTDLAASYIYLSELNTNNSVAITADNITVTNTNTTTNISSSGINTSTLILNNGYIKNNLSIDNTMSMNTAIIQNGYVKNNLSVTGTISTQRLNASTTTIQNGYVTNNLSVTGTISAQTLNASITTLQNGYVTNNLSVTGTISAQTMNASSTTLQNGYVKNNLSVTGTVSTQTLNASTSTMQNMSITNNLSVDGTINTNNLNTYSRLDISGQVLFNTPPHIPDPMFGNDAASKGYVDSLVGQYSGGLNLFLNNSLTSTVNDPSNNICKLLLPTVDNAASSDIHTTITSDTNYLINSFITDENYPGIVSLPQGLWSMTVYSDISSSSVGIMNYRFVLYKYSNNTFIPIATSTPSDDVNALYGNVGSPTAYHMQAIITEQALLVTDRLAVILYAQSSGVPPGSILKTCFEGEFYSYVQTSLNAGTNLLGSSNTWSGNNTFSISLTAPTLDQSDNSTNAATTAYVRTAISNLSTSNNVWNGTNNFSSLNVSNTASINNLSTNNISVTNASVSNVSVTSITASNVSMFNTSILNASINSITASNASLFNTSILNASIHSITASNASMFNTSILNASIHSITAGNVSMFNVSALNLSAQNASINSITASNVSMFNTSILNASINSITAGNVSMFNTSILNLSARNASIDSITISNVSMFNTSILNLSARNASIDSITAGNVSMFNVSALNLSARNASIDSITVNNVSMFNTSILNLSARNASIDSITAGNVSMFNTSILNLSAQNASINSITVSNVSMFNTSILNASINSITAGNVSMFNTSILNLSARNASIDSITVSNISMFNTSVLNLSARNASINTITVSNVSMFNVSALNFSAFNASIDSITVSNVSMFNTSVLNLSARNASINSITASNVSMFNTSILNASINSITAGNVSMFNTSILNASINSITAGNVSMFNTSILNASINSITAGNVSMFNTSILNLSARNASIDSITVSNVSMFNTSVLNLSARNASIDSITVSNVSMFNTSILNASINSITAGNVSMFNTSILNLSARNASINSITVSNVSMFNVSALNFSAFNASIDSITVSNVSMFNTSILNLSARNASINSITISNVSMFNVSVINLSARNASIDSMTANNASMNNLSIIKAIINNVISPNIDASSTQLSIGGTTATSVVIGKALNPTNILGNLQIAGQAGTPGQVLRSNGTTAEWGDNWTGTATSPLNMGANAITNAPSIDASGSLTVGTNVSTTSLTLGRSGTATSMVGNVDISNSLTLANGTLPLYGASSGSFGTYDNTANRTFATNFPFPNTNFTLVLTGTGTTTRVLIIPPVRNGYTLNIVNRSSGTWTINTTSPDMIYGGFATSAGLNSFGLDLNKSVVLQQINSAYYCLSESISNSSIVATRIRGSNYGNSATTILGNNPHIINSSGEYSYSNYFSFMPVMIFRMTGTYASPTFSLLSPDASYGAMGGYTFIIRNETTGILTIKSSNVLTNCIFINSSSTAQATFSVGINKTVIIQTYHGVGYYIIAYDDNWVGTATNNLNMGAFSIDASSNNLSVGTLTSTALTLGKSGNTTNIQGNLQIAGQAGSSGQVLKSNGTTAEWGDNWAGTATSALDMSANAITNATSIDASANILTVGNNATTNSLTLGRSGAATSMIGNVDISNSLTLANGTLQFYGGTSFATADGTANVVLATTYPNPNTNFTIILSGSTSNRSITLPPAKNGYTITVVITGSVGWNINTTGTEKIYNGYGSSTGKTSLGLLTNKAINMYQYNGAYYITSESNSNSTMIGRNNGGEIYLCGQATGITTASGDYTMPHLGYNPQTVLRFTSLTNPQTLNLYAPTLSNILGGYTFIIRNDGANPLTITAPVACIYTSGSGSAIISYSLGVNKSLTLVTYHQTGYYIASLSDWVGTATSDLTMGSYAITGTSLDTATSGTLSMGTTNATVVNIGKTAVPVNMSILNTSIIDTPVASPLTIGTQTATSVNIARSGVNTNINGDLIAPSFIYTNAIQSISNDNNISFNTLNTTGNVDILTNTARTGTTNMLTGSNVNTFNLGGQNMTTNVSGIAINFTATTNTFINMSTDNLSATNASIDNASITNLSATNVSIDNVSITNLSANNASMNSITANNASIFNLSTLNISTDSITASNVSMFNTSILNLSASNISTNSITASNVSMFNTSILNLSARNASINSITASNVSANNVSILNLSARNASINSITATNASMYNISVSGSINAYNINTDTTIDVSGQVVFNTPPHIPDPMFGNDAASKGYVDSLVGQYSGGLNLFLNNSLTSTVTDPSNNTCKLLLSTVDDASSSNIVTTITTDAIYTINSFITDVNYPGILSLPQGLWSMMVYSDISSSAVGVINYKFILYKYSASTFIPIATSTLSDDVNALYGNVGSPTAYHMQATITEQSLLLTDRIAIILYAQTSGVTPGSQLTTFFEGEYYSYVQSTLNAGTNLLGSSNTWTGNNNFTISLTAPTRDSSDNSTNVATTAYVTTAINNLTSQSNISNGVNIMPQINVSVLAVINNASISNLSATNASMDNVSITNLSATNISNDSITASNVSMFNVSITNLSTNNISTDSITASNVSMFNVSILNLSARNVSVNSITVSNPIITTDGTYTSTTKVVPYNTVALTGGQIAIGSTAGTTSQGITSVAIGYNAANFSQNASAVAIGVNAANFSQGASAVAIGENAGKGLSGTNFQGAGSVAIGKNAGQNTQSVNSVAVGINAGNNNQRSNSVAIGISAGNNNQGANAVAIGNSAGNNNQGGYAVAIGNNAGRTSQAGDGVAIGSAAANSNQSTAAVAVGNFAGYVSQGSYAVAIGLNAGKGVSVTNFQGESAVAIGVNAGKGTTSGQGANAIAIGNNAGVESQTAGSICLNATGIALNPNEAGCFINPIRNGVLGTSFSPPLPANVIYYDTTTFELLKTTIGVWVDTSIIHSSLDSSGTLLSIGTGTATSVNIGKSNVSVNMSILNVSTINVLNLSSSNISVNSITASNVSMFNTSILNLSALNASIDSITASNVSMNNVSILNLSALNASIDSITAVSLDRETAGALNIGTTNATSVSFGGAGATTANITGTTINLVGAVKSNNIDTATAGLLNIGLTTANDVTIGRSGLANARITATNITLTGAVSGLTSLQSGTLNSTGITNANTLTCNTLQTSTAIGGNLNAWHTNTDGTINLISSLSRIGQTNMLRSNLNNTFLLGNKSGSTGLTFTLDGIVANFNSTANNFANLSAQNVSLINASIFNLSVNNASMFNVSIANLSTNNISTDSITASNASMFNVSITNLSTNNISTDSITASNASMFNVSITNLSTNNISTDSITASNASMFNVSITNLSTNNISTDSITANNVSMFNVSITNLSTNNISTDSITSSNASMFNVSALNFSALNISTNSLTASNASMFNVSITNLSTNNISTDSITAGNVSMFNVSITNLSTNNISTNSLTASNVSMFNVSALNFSALNISTNSITASNVSMFNTSILNLSAQNASIDSITANNVSMFNVSIANLSSSNAILLNVITPTIDASATQLTIGGTTATSVVIGKALNTTNILGNLQIAGQAGSSGQVLVSNGTTAEWGDNWSGSASSPLNMGMYIISSSALDNSGSTLTIGENNTLLTIGKTGTFTNIKGNVQINGASGSFNNVLTSDGLTASWAAPTWVSTATNHLNMSIYSIEASSNNLYLGTLTSTGVTIGKAGNPTNIQGNLQIAGQSGSSGQVLISNGAGSVPTWTTYTSGWVGTATSELNMSVYNIVATGALTLGETEKSINLRGSVQVPTALTYGTTPNLVVAYGGQSTDVYDTTTTNNIETRITNSGGLREQNYNVIISPSSSGTGALILPLVKPRHYVYIFNGSAYNWTIASQSGELIINGLAGSGIPSTSSITLKPSQTLGFVQVDGGALGKFNICLSEIIQGTSPSFSGLTCPTIDTATAGTLAIGGATTNNVAIGRAGLANAGITATNIALTGTVSGLTGLTTSSITTRSWGAGDATAEVFFMTGNTTGKMNFINSGTRTGQTDMITSTSNNTVNFGGRSGLTGMTLNLGGIVANFNSTANNFTNSTANTFTNLSSTNVSIINASIFNLSVNNASMFNVSISNLSASAAIINNVISPNIDASAAQLTVGGTNATSLVLGKAANTTNILGNLQINSDSGTAGQVLTSNGTGTVPTWTTVSGVGGGGWVGIATSNLSMGAYSIIGSTLDSSNTNLTIGGTTAASVTIGKALNTTNILGNLQIGGSAGTAGQVLTSNNVSTVWSNPSWVGTATSNLSMGTNSIICNNIDASATTLTIGGVTAQGVTLGKALTTTNILGNLNIAGSTGSNGQVLRSNGTTAVWGDNWTPTATSDLNMGANNIIGTSLDSTTTLAIGSGTATSINIGKTAVPVNMSVLNVSESSASNMTVGGTLFVGTQLCCDAIKANPTSDNMLIAGSSGNGNVTIGNVTNTTQTFTIACPVATASALTVNSTLTNNTIDSSTTAIGMSLWTSNLTGVANILTGATRSAITNMLTSTNNNILNLGGRSSTNGMTLNLEGVATNFLATANNFTNAITAGAMDCLTAGGNLLVGATNAVLTLGNTARATTLRGSTLAINLGGSLGSSGQVLTSNGTNATWQTPTGGVGGWVGTATSSLNMASYDITNVRDLTVNSNFIYNGNYIYGKLPYIFNSNFTADTSINGTLINMQFFYWIMPQTIVARNLFLPTTTYIGQIIIVKNDSTVSHNIHAVSPNTIRANTASATTSIPIASYSSRQLYCANNVAGSIVWVVISLQ
jgi:trimeric autotransporter adhesin